MATLVAWLGEAATTQEKEVLLAGGESGERRTIAEVLNHVVRRRLAVEFKRRTGAVPPALRAGKILKFTTIGTKLTDLANLPEQAVDLTLEGAKLPRFREQVCYPSNPLQPYPCLAPLSPWSLLSLCVPLAGECSGRGGGGGGPAGAGCGALPWGQAGAQRDLVVLEFLLVILYCAPLLEGHYDPLTFVLSRLRDRGGGWRAASSRQGLAGCWRAMPHACVPPLAASARCLHPSSPTVTARPCGGQICRWRWVPPLAASSCRLALPPALLLACIARAMAQPSCHERVIFFKTGWEGGQTHKTHLLCCGMDPPTAG